MKKQKQPDTEAANSTKKIYEKILRLIVEKQLPPGGKINQNKLAGQMRSSRTPVVKALHLLEAQGLVDSITDRGFFVHELSMLELLELFTLREALDSIIVFELIETITPEQMQRLEDLMAVFERAAELADEEEYRKCDQDFHRLLLEFSRNTLVKRINEYFQIYNRCFVVGLLREPRQTLPEHRRLVDAFKKKDRDEARDAVAAHIANTKIFLQELVKRLQQIGIDPSTIPFKGIEK
jgi:DNA-binding GntR family transcriptional regulator